MSYTWAMCIVHIDTQPIHVGYSQTESDEFEDEDSEYRHHGNSDCPRVDCPFSRKAFALELFYRWCQSVLRERNSKIFSIHRYILLRLSEEGKDRDSQMDKSGSYDDSRAEILCEFKDDMGDSEFWHPLCKNRKECPYK